jgi:predicted  nucleic acid-binding Zn-ribbon protein
MKRKIIFILFLLLGITINSNLYCENIFRKYFAKKSNESIAQINITNNDKIEGIINYIEQGIISGDIGMIIKYCDKNIKVDNSNFKRLALKKKLGERINNFIAKNKNKENDNLLLNIEFNKSIKFIQIGEEFKYSINYKSKNKSDNIILNIKETKGKFVIAEINGIFSLFENVKKDKNIQGVEK